MKMDTTKPSLRLLPWRALETVARVMEWAVKEKGYEEGNWQEGKHTNIYVDAALRHLSSWCRGETLDSESKLPHLAHAAASVLIALWHSQKQPSSTSLAPSKKETPPTL